MKLFLALALLIAGVAHSAPLTIDKPLTVTVPDDWTVREFTFAVTHSALRPYVISVKAKGLLELDSGEVVRNADYLAQEACQASLIVPVSYDAYGDPIPALSSLATYTCASGVTVKYVWLYRGTYTVRVASWSAGQYVVSVRAVEDTRR